MGVVSSKSKRTISSQRSKEGLKTQAEKNILNTLFHYPQPAKLDLNKKSLSKQKTIQNFTIDAKGFRKTRIENPPTREIEVTSEIVLANLPMVGRSAGTG